MRLCTFGLLCTICLFPQFLCAAELVNINTADATALETLPGIGAAKAAAIIDYRETNGLFQSIAEIQNVSGIGPATFADIEDLITVEGGVATIPDADEEEEEQEETAQENDDRRNSGSNESAPSPVKTLRLIAPKVAYVNQPVEFDVVPGGSGERLVRYSWSFGDANTAGTKSPTHAYADPGMYVVVVESRYLGEDALARTEITVLPPMLSLARTDAGDIQLHNDAKYEIDLSGFTLQGEKSFTIPEKTILLPSATLTARRGLLEQGPRALIRVLDPAGFAIVSLLPYEVSSGREAVESEERSDTAAVISEEPLAFEEEAAVNIEPRQEITEILPNPAEPMVYRLGEAAVVESEGDLPLSGMIPYLGLIGLLAAGIFGVYAKRSA